jgi:hypothetical protein
MLESTGDMVIAVPKPNDQSEREKLIRRRWTETGIKMWNPDIHGAGHAALNIQGRVELLPPKPGQTLPGYDKLEFKLIGGRIVAKGLLSIRQTVREIANLPAPRPVTYAVACDRRADRRAVHTALSRAALAMNVVLGDVRF